MFNEALDALSNCKTIFSLDGFCADLATSEGYSSYAIRCRASHLRVPNEVVLRSWPSGWEQATSDFASASPVVSEAKYRHSPFTWAELRRTRRSNATERKLWDIADSWGWRNGFVVPMHGPGRSLSVFSMASYEADLNLTVSNRRRLHFLSFAIYERCRYLQRKPNAQQRDWELTERELDCFRWIAEGRTDEAIARYMGLAPVTVRFHVNNGRRKLNARSRAQAVAILAFSGVL